MKKISLHSFLIIVGLVILFAVGMGCVGEATSNFLNKYSIDSQRALESPQSTPNLLKALNSGSFNDKVFALKSLSRITPFPEEAVPDVVEKLSSNHGHIRYWAGQFILKYGKCDYECYEKVVAAFSSEPETGSRYWRIVFNGIVLLYQPDNKNAIDSLVSYLASRDYRERSHSAQTLGQMGKIDKKLFQGLKQLSYSDPHERVKIVARQALISVSQIEELPESTVMQKSLQKPVIRLPQLVNSLPESKRANRDAIAVIIGNKNYSPDQNIPAVDFAHNDAEAMKRYVIRTLGYREGNIIFIKDATQAEMVSTFGNEMNPHGKLSDWIKPGRSDVFVFYSGHGAPSLKSGKGYLLPVDADPMKIELSGYSLNTLYANLNILPARQVTVLIDACFSGSSSNGTVVKNASSIVVKPVVSNARIRNGVVITASTESEVASWDKNKRLGLLTRYFIEGIVGNADKHPFGNSDNQVTLAELKKFLESEVTYQARREYGRDQHPQVAGDKKRILSNY